MMKKTLFIERRWRMPCESGLRQQNAATWLLIHILIIPHVMGMLRVCYWLSHCAIDIITEVFFLLVARFICYDICERVPIKLPNHKDASKVVMEDSQESTPSSTRNSNGKHNINIPSWPANRHDKHLQKCREALIQWRNECWLKNHSYCTWDSLGLLPDKVLGFLAHSAYLETPEMIKAELSEDWDFVDTYICLRGF